MDPALWWVLAMALIVIGIAGTFLPGIPGPAAVFGGMLLAAWIDHFSRVGWVGLTVLGALTAAALAVDVLAGLLGARRVGASRLALIGAALGTLFGIFFGFVGVLIGPFVGAVAGELLTHRRLDTAARVGIGTWVGLAVGALAKAAILFGMLGVFLIDYFIA
jgi:hypothetical protein